MVETQILRLDLLSLQLSVYLRKLRKLTLQTHLQLWSNNFTLTWPDLWRQRWPGGQPNLFFFDEFSRTIDCRFRVSDQICSFGAMGGGGSKWPPSGWWVARRPSGCLVRCLSAFAIFNPICWTQYFQPDISLAMFFFVVQTPSFICTGSCSHILAQYVQQTMMKNMFCVQQCTIKKKRIVAE